MGKLTAECAIIAAIGWCEAAVAGAVLTSAAFQKLVRQTAVFIKNVWSGTAAAVQVEEILLCFGGTTSLTEILRQYISDEASALLARLQAINALPDNMLRTAYVFIREYCSKAEVSLRELRIILKNAGKIADEKLKALVDWVRGKPEYYNKIEAEGLELLREEEAELADKGLLDKVDDVLEEKSGKLAEDETLSGEDVESAIEKAKNTAERDSHPCSVVKEGQTFTDYQNEAGTTVRVPKQGKKTIENMISIKRQSTDIGEHTEAKVADYIMEHTDAVITDFSNKVRTPQGLTLGDIDVATETQWIEVKTSVGEAKPKQIEKYVVYSKKDYINVNNKEVILYIDEPLGELTKQQVDALKEIEEMGVKIVNGLEELGKVIK